MVQMNVTSAGMKPEELDSFYRRLNESLSSIPGVSHVSWSLWSPMDGNNRSDDVFVAGQPAPPPGADTQLASWVRVSPDYFTTIGTKLLQGRVFSESDNRTAANVAIVDEAFVKRFLHGQNPIGAHFGENVQAAAGMYTIVGVVEDAQYWAPNDAQELGHPMYFLPAWQWPKVDASVPKAAIFAEYVNATHYMSSLEIETRGTVPDLEARVTAALQVINPNLMITSFQSFARQVNLGFNQQQMIVKLTSLFGFVALVLAAVGLYGVTAYTVAQRTSEIGIRMALGADHRRVQKMVLGDAFRLVGLGLLLGIPAAVAAGHAMAAELYGVQEWNVLVLGTTAVVLCLVALPAAALPARRAAGVEPIEALRGQ
jgi:predicted permease